MIKIPLKKQISGEVRKVIAPMFKKLSDLFDKPLDVKHSIKVEGVPEQIEAKISFPKDGLILKNIKDLPKPQVKVNVQKAEFPKAIKILNPEDFKNEIVTQTVEFPDIQKVEQVNKADLKADVKDAVVEVFTEMAKNPDNAFNVRAINYDEGKPHFGNFGGGGGVPTGSRSPEISTDFHTYNLTLTASGVLTPFEFPLNTKGFFVKFRTQSKKLRLRTINELNSPYFTIPQNGWWSAFPTNLKEKIIYLEGQSISQSETVEIIAFTK